MSTLLEHRTTTLPLITSRFVNETFPGWSRTMEACIDMLADHGGAIFALVLYWGMELSSAMPPCDEKCHFFETLRCRRVTDMSEEVGGPGGGLAGLCLSWKEPWSWAWVWGLGEKNSTSVCSLQLSQCSTRKSKSTITQSNWYSLLDHPLPPQNTSCDDTKDCATMLASRLSSQATTFFKTMLPRPVSFTWCSPRNEVPNSHISLSLSTWP
jgi:hypothetical protein